LGTAFPYDFRQKHRSQLNFLCLATGTGREKKGVGRLIWEGKGGEEGEKDRKLREA